VVPGARGGGEAAPHPGEQQRKGEAGHPARLQAGGLRVARPAPPQHRGGEDRGFLRGFSYDPRIDKSNELIVVIRSPSAWFSGRAALLTADTGRFPDWQAGGFGTAWPFDICPKSVRGL
jgi:hypothetical protein